MSINGLFQTGRNSIRTLEAAMQSAGHNVANATRSSQNSAEPAEIGAMRFRCPSVGRKGSVRTGC